MVEKTNFPAIFMVCISVIILGSFFIFAKAPAITGAAVSQTTQSKVIISYYYAISLSANLADGIDFGNITVLPAVNLNATDNINGANSTTTMWVLESNDSNVHIDLCHKAQGPLNTTGGDTLALGNYTWSDSLTNTASQPAGPPGDNVFTTAFVKANNVNIAPNGKGYYRYWLSIPTGQPAGTYTNTVEYKAVYTGASC